MEKQKTEKLNQTLKWVSLISLVIVILYFGKTLFIPLLFGLLIAIIVYPICKKMEAKNIPRAVSITLALFFVGLIIGGIVALLQFEIRIFLGELPVLADKTIVQLRGLSETLESSLGINLKNQQYWLAKLSENSSNYLNQIIGGILNATISTLVLAIIIPIYAALFLYHRETFVRFLENITSTRYQEKLHKILHEIVFTYFKFVKGTFYVYCIVGVLNSAGLYLLGIEHAFMYGLIAAFMTIIPYVGIFISAAIPVSIAFITKDSIWYPIGVISIFTIVQYLEANVIYPKVVGNQLNLSTWATLVGIVAGTILWGVAGMVIIVPFLAILKIVSDYLPEWKPLNILLNRDEGYKK